MPQSFKKYSNSSLMEAMSFKKIRNENGLTNESKIMSLELKHFVLTRALFDAREKLSFGVFWEKKTLLEKKRREIECGHFKR